MQSKYLITEDNERFDITGYNETKLNKLISELNNKGIKFDIFNEKDSN